MTAETDQRDGRTVTIVKFEHENPKVARIWFEYRLDPAQGNYPVFIRASSGE